MSIGTIPIQIKKKKLLFKEKFKLQEKIDLELGKKRNVSLIILFIIKIT